MFKKVLFSAAMLLLASYSVSATIVDCANMSPVDCKKEFGMVMDKGLMMIFTEYMKTQMTNMMQAFTAVKDEMPADSMFTKMIMQAMDDMKTQMPMLDEMTSKDMANMRAKWDHFVQTMRPDFEKAEEEDSANKEKFEEIMKKHIKMEDMTEILMNMLKKFENMAMDMLNTVREEDMKEYPQYIEMKDTMKTMKEATDMEKKADMFANMIKMMSNFFETPFATGMYNMMTNGNKKSPFL